MDMQIWCSMALIQQDFPLGIVYFAVAVASWRFCVLFGPFIFLCICFAEFLNWLMLPSQHISSWLVSFRGSRCSEDGVLFSVSGTNSQRESRCLGTHIARLHRTNNFSFLLEKLKQIWAVKSFLVDK